MQDRAVYFIGGTFGSSSSNWQIAIITAFLTAFASLGVGYLIESYKRHRDTTAIAGAILAEISAILQLLAQLRTEQIYSDLRENMRKMLDASEPWVSLPDTTFPITVYEKCVDRIGTLGKGPAMEVVRFYNFLNGVRSTHRIALSSSDIPIQSRIRAVEFILDVFKTEKPRAEALEVELQAIADRRWLLLLR